MPLYELPANAGEEMVPFLRVQAGPELYESQIEQLVWDDLEAFTGEALFPVARQPHVAGGGVPDILALDAQGRVVVIEVKRDVDRSQLAQCLEYAGWARLTNLDEIASLYGGSVGHSGPAAFFTDWLEFTDTSTPVTIEPSPRLFLVARTFAGRTKSALDFLEENGLPVTVVPVTVYQDTEGRRIIDIGVDHEPTTAGHTPQVTKLAKKNRYMLNGVAVTVADLITTGYLVPNEPVEFIRPKKGEHYHATILESGAFRLEDETIHQSPSLAAIRAADIAAYDGWYAWRVPRLSGTKLHEIREQYIAQNGQPQP